MKLRLIPAPSVPRAYLNMFANLYISTVFCYLKLCFPLVPPCTRDFSATELCPVLLRVPLRRDLPPSTLTSGTFQSLRAWHICAYTLPQPSVRRASLAAVRTPQCRISSHTSKISSFLPWRVNLPRPIADSGGWLNAVWVFRDIFPENRLSRRRCRDAVFMEFERESRRQAWAGMHWRRASSTRCAIAHPRRRARLQHFQRPPVFPYKESASRLGRLRAEWRLRYAFCES